MLTSRLNVRILKPVKIVTERNHTGQFVHRDPLRNEDLMNWIDLHVHSSASDGTLTPAELVAYAKEKGLSAFALTDHDTVAGIDEARRAAAAVGLTLIPGIELSCKHEGQDIHMLGLGIDPGCPVLLTHLEDIQHARAVRNEIMLARLSEAGFDVSLKEFLETFPGASLTRTHIARLLMQKGYVASIQEGYERYVGNHSPYYVPKECLSPIEAISWIHEAGGKAVLAHPLLYHMSEEKLHAFVAQLSAHGLDGIEAIYSCNEGTDEDCMLALAKEFDLCVSGGSDFHGANKPSIDLMIGKGNLRIPAQLLDALFNSKTDCNPQAEAPV